MQKITQMATAGVLAMTMSAAMAADSMNGTVLSEKGMTMTVTGTASVTIPNDEAQMHWSVSSQAKTLKEATAQAIKTMNEGLAQIKAVSDQLQLQTQSMNSYPVYGETRVIKHRRLLPGACLNRWKSLLPTLTWCLRLLKRSTALWRLII